MLTTLLMLQVAAPLFVVDDDVRRNQDLLHYDIVLEIPDSGGTVKGVTRLRYLVAGEKGPLLLDFDSTLTIDSIIDERGRKLAKGVWQFTAKPAGTVLAVDHWGAVGDTLTLVIAYHGEPSNGLFIQENVHHQRSAFADNWPNRAHHWFPGEDHPSDKATVSFAVEVPAGWRAVANGALEGVDSLPGGRSVWRWREQRKIPPYTMVIGAGRFAVADLETKAGVALSSWTFPEDSAFAIRGPFHRAGQIVEAFTSLIGPFPYEKLAHVESSTRFGGMENSSAIFYPEQEYADGTLDEFTVAHETAHQWFGDAVTPYDWHHLWLSEGFATYLEAFFYHLVGEDSVFRARMAQHRAAYLSSPVIRRPVIDTTETDLFALLNANNYLKAAWILHMLRQEVGDSAFARGLRAYYAVYRDSTALSGDFARVVGQAAGRPLDWFFRQWLLQPGYPKITARWRYEPNRRALALEVEQLQPPAWGTYRVTVPVLVELGSGDLWRVEVGIEGARSRVELAPIASKPARVVLDLNGDLLLEIVSLTEER